MTEEVIDRSDIPGVWHGGVQCDVRRLVYDFELLVGALYLPRGDCTDMSGCIRMFEAIDSRVCQIQTYSGEARDTIYDRTSGEWRAYGGVGAPGVLPRTGG